MLEEKVAVRSIRSIKHFGNFVAVVVIQVEDSPAERAIVRVVGHLRQIALNVVVVDRAQSAWVFDPLIGLVMKQRLLGSNRSNRVS